MMANAGRLLLPPMACRPMMCARCWSPPMARFGLAPLAGVSPAAAPVLSAGRAWPCRLHGEIGALELRLRASQIQASAPLTEPLSEREQTVLRLLAAGMRNSEIARELIVSPNTVKAHIKQLYRKLGASDRVQAINAARRQGLVG